jgi:hypothetical protein
MNNIHTHTSKFKDKILKNSTKQNHGSNQQWYNPKQQQQQQKQHNND